MTPFRLHDSMRRSKLEFEPLVAGRVGIYVCGPTTYAPAHIGHAYSAIAFDTVRRSLEFLGWTVKYVRNVTDIDDKIIKRAHDTGEDLFAMSARFAADYNRDMARFGVRAPDVEPKVTEHISEIVAIVGRLVANGHAYVVGGDVYYEVDKFPAYGRLSGHTLDELRAGARVDVDERKRAPADFALWKSAKPGEPSWDSPWGQGRPGWHIECSAMTVKHLGATFDIHAGGKDLIFPHHENEIAQSQGADGDGTFAHYWMHNGFLNFAGEKMSKSLGNVFDCAQIADAVGGEALRFFCVSHHYRMPVDFDVQIVDGAARFLSLEAADRKLAYFYETLCKLAAPAIFDSGAGPVLPEAEHLIPAATAALADDFNTPIVMAALYEAAKLANKLFDAPKGIDKQLRLRTLKRLSDDLYRVGHALGIFERAWADYLAERRERLVRIRKIDVAAIQAKLVERASARADKDFSRADAIRAELAALGVELFDLLGTTDWRVHDAD